MKINSAAESTYFKHLVEILIAFQFYMIEENSCLNFKVKKHKKTTQ